MSLEPCQVSITQYSLVGHVELDITTILLFRTVVDRNA